MHNAMKRTEERQIIVPAGKVSLPAFLAIPPGASGVVLFAHGSGSSRLSPRNIFVAESLRRAGLATMLMDLLTEGEDVDPAQRFAIDLLTSRLSAGVRWLRHDPATKLLPVGLFGASTGAAAALAVAARMPSVRAVVSRGGRPDLAPEACFEKISAPVLLIIGGNDEAVVGLNRLAYRRLKKTKKMMIVPGATHLFEEPGALTAVAAAAAAWFQKYLS
jgi:dienelactone hydrolase